MVIFIDGRVRNHTTCTINNCPMSLKTICYNVQLVKITLIKEMSFWRNFPHWLHFDIFWCSQWWQFNHNYDITILVNLCYNVWYMSLPCVQINMSSNQYTDMHNGRLRAILPIKLYSTCYNYQLMTCIVEVAATSQQNMQSSSTSNSQYCIRNYVWLEYCKDQNKSRLRVWNMAVYNALYGILNSRH